MKFDMMRVRVDGRVVARTGPGQLRAVRGELYIKDEFYPDLNRYSRTGTFMCEDGQQLKLLDAALMHASPTMLTISGFERGDRNCIPIDFAQTWVLVECEGPEPQGSIGPPFRS